jgi:CrcB protein
MIFLFASLLGGLGALLRYGVDMGVMKKFKARNEKRVVRRDFETNIGRISRFDFPLGIVIVNISACLLVGLLTGWALAHTGAFATLPEAASAATVKYLLGSGFLGGYSTFSTASLDGVRLLEQKRYVAALIHTGGMLVLSIAFCFVGLWIGSLL